MNNQESFEFIREYFDELFGRRNIAALDTFLDPAYFDDDIGDPHVDHIQNSKEYLAEWFQKLPSIGVDVIDAVNHDDVIAAYLSWYVVENQAKRIIFQGVAHFVMKGKKILKRHTFMYYQE